MAYVPTFEHDIFISYAHADNDVGERVVAFHRDLVQRLTTRLGARSFHKPQEWVFFDRVGLSAGDEFSPKLERAAQRSAVMIALVSPSYLQAPFCIRETEWFLGEATRSDPMERRLIPVVLNHADEDGLRQFPQFATKLLRAFSARRPLRCSPAVQNGTGARNARGPGRRSPSRSETTAWGGVHWPGLRGGRGVPRCADRRTTRLPVYSRYAIFGQEAAVRQALAEAKLAVHILGGSGTDAVDNVEAILLSLEHCQGKTVGYLPPGQRLSRRGARADCRGRDQSAGRDLNCTPAELAQILPRELESFRLPDPSTPLALACDKADLNAVRSIAREIHAHEGDAFTVGIPDFLAEPTALAFVAWKKLLTKSPSVLVYWADGQKRDPGHEHRALSARREAGRALTSRCGDTAEKREWQPGDIDTEKIVNDQATFDYEPLRPFLNRVREKARR